MFFLLLLRLYSALLFVPQARAIIKAEPPFAIMHINEPWTAISGLTQSEAEGQNLSDTLRLHSSQVS
jgi:PAS domain-containing protein